MEDIKDFLRSFKEFDAAYCELKKIAQEEAWFVDALELREAWFVDDEISKEELTEGDYKYKIINDAFILILEDTNKIYIQRYYEE